MNDTRMPKAEFFSELGKGLRDRGAPRGRYKDQLKRQLVQAGVDHKDLADARIRQGRMEVNHQARSSEVRGLQSEHC